ncbi:ATP-dependent DNA helicase [Cohnella faecalis]|uniref:ATP-dependent DNA helicase n=1 Tax=Cohnella faecalis TaxID=2315694 RepID=A0A398CEN4_9BACL|nr:ATP-dependent DNA helicase [Cohnella faecalis]RIE00905.1 ATP-dependent DNA helicase [Cohnella faecalis]
MLDKVTIAVRPLVEYAFRGGSLDAGFRSAASLTEGTKAHQAVQKGYGEADRSEVYVSGEIECDNIAFVIDGRCDGVLASDDGTFTIDEIKSTVRDLALIDEESYPVHWAQARCYAYLYAREHALDRIGIQLTYVQIDTDRQKRFVQEATCDELGDFVSEVLHRYAPYAKMLFEHQRRRDESIRSLPFPFRQYRKGQRTLAGAIYKSIENGTGLFARAPTGIGKTMSTVFPAVKAMGNGLLQQLYYLTARTTTRTAAEEAFNRMKAEGLHLHSVTITAKEKVCFQEQVDCRAEACEFANGYYDRINDAILDVLKRETSIDRTVVESYARKHRVCPFEFSLDAAYASDAVICDYNYIFDPRVSLKRMFAERKAKTALLVDEAHNLIDRAREMYSAELNKRDFMLLEREFKGIRADIGEAAKTINRLFIQLRKQKGGASFALAEKPDELLKAVEAFAAIAENTLAGHGSGHDRSGVGDEEGASFQGWGDGSRDVASASGSDLLLEAYFAASAFVRIGKLYDDERYVTFVEPVGNEVRLKLLCLDPSELLRQAGKGFRTRIFFSATLSPLRFYMDVLGAGENDYSVSVPSPFEAAQWEVAALPISTRYADRADSRAPIVALLGQLLERRPGNYLFFFPSYAYMNDIYEAFCDSCPDQRTMLQGAAMPEEERDRFLAAFDADNESAFAGFAVLGGVFSEGVDLVGDRLTGVVVVGVGLPQIGPERDLIRDHYNATTGKGFDYAYVYPGMNKVLQAGGRLIRSETDRGVLILADDRYLLPHYRRLLPEEWRNFKIIRGEDSYW